MRVIVLLADMRCHQVLPVLVVELSQKADRLCIAEVTVIAADPELQGSRVRAVTQHLLVVVEFKQQGIELLQLRHDMRCDRTCIGQDTHPLAAVGENILAGFGGIMRNSERRDANVANAEISAVGIDLVQLTAFSPFAATQCAGRRPDRDCVMPRQRLCPAQMV